jgi:hypothetical protein
MPVSKKRKKPAAQPKRQKKPEPKWESFEKIVAAIHSAEMNGATVTWNEQIQGRQFDVAIRFKSGFYDYLTLIECKDYNHSVPVEKVEAFATKFRHQKASKAIMVSPHGFQKGAKEVARREGIELYSLREINKVPQNLLTDFLMTTVVLQPLAFYTRDKKEVYTFSRKENEVENQIEQIILKNYGNMTLGRLLFPLKQLIFPLPLPRVPDFPPFKRATDKMQYDTFRMADNTFITNPETGERILVELFYFRYWKRTGYVVDTQGIDPTVFKGLMRHYEYKNELNDEVVVIDAAKVGIGVDTVIDAGKFYKEPRFGEFFYHCEKVEDGYFTVFLIKSVQHNKLVRSETRLSLSEAKFFVEVTDEDELIIAEKLYREFLEYKQKNSPTFVEKDVKIWFS